MTVATDYPAHREVDIPLRDGNGAPLPGRELIQFNKIFDGFTKKYPWITVNSVGGVGQNGAAGQGATTLTL